MRLPICSAILIPALLPAASLAATIHVRASAPASGNGASWATAYSNLTDALAAAAPGDEVWVARGTYPTTTTANRYASFIVPSAVKLRGGFAGSETSLAQRPADPDIFTADPASDTILTGEIGSPTTDDNAFTVVTIADGADATTLVDRVVITRGTNPSSLGAGLLAYGTAALVTHTLFTDNRANQGAGLWAAYSSAFTIRDSAFTNNSTNVDGGGALFSGGTAAVERVTFRANNAGQAGFFGTGGGLASTFTTIAVRDCLFEHNSAIYGGGLYADSDATFDRCTIRSNDAFSPTDPTGATRGFGGGLYVDAGPIFRDCDIIENTGDNAGGMSNQETGGSTFIRCRFLRNASITGGAGTLLGQNTTFAGCLFDANTGYSGPMFYLRSYPKPASATFINCTSVNHLPGQHPPTPGAISNSGSVVIYNSIFWNIGPEFSGNTPGVGWSNIKGFAGGLFNISADPHFINPAASDYRLQPGSPCIDAGHNGVVPLDVLADLAGVARYRDDPATTDTGVGPAPIVDMGAYEFQPAPPPCTGDADGSRAVNFSDITSVLANFGATYTTTGPGDADASSAVNFTDITTVLANFGSACP